MGKLSINELANVLVEKNELNEGDAQRFVTAIFDVIQKGIDRDKLVKIKGFGTFKVVGVDARESVNVNTGERVLIESHSKISFTPDTTMKELVNKPFSGFETVVLNEGVYFDDMSSSAATATEEQATEEPVVAPEPEPIVETFVEPEPIVAPEPEPVVETFVEPEPVSVPEQESVVETFVAPEPIATPEPEPVVEPMMDELDDAIPMPTEAEEPVYPERQEQPMVDEHMIEIVDEPDDAIPMPTEMSIMEEPDDAIPMPAEPEIPVMEKPHYTPVYEVSKPEPVYEPQPKPVYEAPKPEPVYEPQPEPVYEAPKPEPVYEPQPEPVCEEPKPAPVYEEPKPVYEPQPQPQSIEEEEEEVTPNEEDSVLEDQFDEKQPSNWGKWLCVVIFTLAAGFVGGYFVGNDFSLNYDKLLGINNEKQPVAIVKKAPEKKVVQQVAVQKEQRAAEEEAPKAETKSESTKSTTKPEPTKSTAKSESAKSTTKSEPAKTVTTTEHDKYAAMDNRVRLGAYRIVGLDKEVTVREGDNVERVSRRYLGSGMSCYVEVYNGINSKTPLKAGQKLKIPKLEWKKKKK